MRALPGVVVLLGLLSACSGGSTPPTTPFNSAEVHGIDYGRGLRLADGAGTPRALEDFRGQVLVVFFGFTSCPDVCPTTMADLAAALRDVDESTRSKIDVQFVSTDPNRDTPAQITRWLEGFDPSFRGGRAEINDVIDAAKVYGIGIEPPEVSDDDYQVTHGAQLLVLEPGGGMVGYFQELSGADAYAKAIPILVDKYAA